MRRGQRYLLNLPGYLVNNKQVEVVRGANNFARDITVQFTSHFRAGKNLYCPGDTMQVAPGELRKMPESALVLS